MMSPLHISLGLTVGIGVLSVWNTLHLKTRRIRQLRLEKFRDDFTTDLSIELSEPVILVEDVLKKLKKYPEATTDVGAQVLIDYHNCITGSEREYVSEIFYRLGHLKRAINGSVSKNQDTRLKCLTWLLYLKLPEAEEIFFKSTDDNNRLIRLISLAGLSMISDLPIIMNALTRMIGDFDGKLDAAVFIMHNIGKRFGPEELLELTRSMDLDDRLRRSAVLALAEMKPIEYLEEIDYILENFGLLSPQETLNVRYRLRDLYQLMSEAA